MIILFQKVTAFSSYFCHSEANNGITDDLPELCSSVYTFTLNKNVQLLWQLEVYRVCFKTCTWQFMCINPQHTDMRLQLCVLLILFSLYLRWCFINYNVKQKLAKETMSLGSLTLEPQRSLDYQCENETQSLTFQIPYISINTNFSTNWSKAWDLLQFRFLSSSVTPLLLISKGKLGTVGYIFLLNTDI